VSAGGRHTLVTFERGTATTDDYGGETLTWGQVAQAWARVTYGTGAERRQAAQEQAEQAATIMALWTPTLAAVAVKDRITFNGASWDITSVAPIGLNTEIHFTATRSA